VLSAIIGCGKKPAVLDVVTSREEIRSFGEFDRYTEKQSLVCLANNCPESIARVMIYQESEGKITNCTGYLVGNDVLATSASCLPKEITQGRRSCTNRIRFIFAATEFEPARTAECADVISFQNRKESSLEPALISNDVALLQLDQNIYRKKLIPSESFLSANIKPKLWAIKMFERDTSIVQSQNCELVFNSYANPLKKSMKADALLFKGCEVPDEARGGAVVDDLGRVYATAFAPLPRSTYVFFRDRALLETGKVNPLMYATNTTCYFNGFFLPYDFSRSPECTNSWTAELLSSWRTDVLVNPNLHKKIFDQMVLENQQNEERNLYVRWKLDFTKLEERNSFRASYTPECFDNVKEWMPTIRIKTKFRAESKILRYDVIMRFDADLKALSKFRNDPVSETIALEFSTKSIKKTNKSFLKWTRGGRTQLINELPVCE
jgi:hypothetical protein